jgi:hypothetical protein
MIRTRWALATLVAVCLVGACSDDDPEPKIADPTPSASESSSSASVSTSPTESASPALGPEETVRAWVDARNAALQDGDTEKVEALGSLKCRTCEDSLQPIRDVYAHGGHFETTGWSVLAAKVDSQTDSSAKVSTGIEYAAGQTFPDADSEPVQYDSEKHVVQFRLVLEGGQWRLSFIGYLS